MTPTEKRIIAAARRYYKHVTSQFWPRYQRELWHACAVDAAARRKRK